MLSRFEAIVVRAGEKVFAVSKWVSYLNSVIAVVLLTYRYGFRLSEEEVEDMLFRFDIQFGIYLILFFVRLLFSYNRRDFIRSAPVETGLVFFMVFHGLINSLFDFKIMLYLMELLGTSNPMLDYQHLISLYLVVMIGLVVTDASVKITELQIKPASTFIISFILLIFIGTGMLMLPTMTPESEDITFLNALFTSASASCVTGLAVVDTGTFFTTKGHVVILMLIQLGGLGIVSFATFFATFLAKGVGIKHQAIIQDFLSSESLSSAKGLMRQIIFITLSIEFLGFLAIFFSWEEDLFTGQDKLFSSLSEKIFYSVFHAISAFCNAGFSLFTNGLYNSDKMVAKMYQLHFVIAVIILFGGFGFSAIQDAFWFPNIKDRIKRPWKKLKIGTQISVYSSLILVAVGTVGFMVLEFEQQTDRTIIEAFITSLFQSVVTRTAGFNTMDFGSLRVPTLILTIFLMFIGGGPGSTAGGIKVNTFVLVVLSAVGSIRSKKNITIARRNIPNSLVSKAFSILMFSVTYNTVAIFLLSITDSDKTIMHLVFEQVSAFATVGLSMGITESLSAAGKTIIICSMFVGRVGTLTLALALSNTVKTNSFRYPDVHLMVG